MKCAVYLPVIILFLLFSFSCLNTQAAKDEAGYPIADNFNTYPAGSPGLPQWDTDTFGWEMEKGEFSYNGKIRGTAFYTADSWARKLTVKAILKINRAVTEEWKVAGLIIQKDGKNFWHLALVESPDKDGKRHFAELSEMHDGIWNAQSRQKTRLTAETFNTACNWEYGKPYLLTLTLEQDGITGIVSGMDGKETASVHYRFDNTLSVRLGRPGLVASGLDSSFSRFRADPEEPVPIPAPSFPPYTSPDASPLKGKKTGFFHTEMIDDTWWLTDPAGRLFFAAGTDHANYNVHWCEKLGYAPYHRNAEKKYGSEAAWAEASSDRLKAWGFNTLGTGSSLGIRYRGLPWMENLTLGMRFADYEYITPRTTWTGFPDVFSPRFKTFCEITARQVCVPLKDDPWLVGYFIDNELEWQAWTGKGLFADTFSRPGNSPARQALITYLEERFGSVTAYNNAFAPDIRTFGTLADMTAPPVPVTDNAHKAINGFIRLVAERYFAITTGAIRKYDPNHLILGCRFAGQAPGIWDIAGKYSDIISVNCYRTMDLETGRFTDNFPDELKGWQKAAKKPFMIAEWSFPALDAGLPCRHGAGQRVSSQKERAFAFAAFQKFLFSQPYIVGSNYFMWADEPALGISSTFPEDSNYGLVNVEDEPYTLLTNTASAVNSLMYSLHNRDTSRLTVNPGNKKLGFIIANEGKREAACTVSFYSGGLILEEIKKIAPGEKTSYDFTSRFNTGPVFTAFTCRVLPSNPYLDENPAGVSLTRTLYSPGTAAEESKARELPILVNNPTDRQLFKIPVTIGSDQITKGRWTLADALSLREEHSGKECPFQIDSFEDRTELSFICGELKPYGYSAYYLVFGSGENPAAHSVKEPLSIPFVLTNGKISLACQNKESNLIFSSIRSGNTELGAFAPLVRLYNGHDQWPATDRIEEVWQFKGPVRTVTEVTARGEYRIRYRFTLYEDRPWFESRVLWVENASRSTFTLKASFHYILSRIGGNSEDDTAFLNRWMDKQNNYSYGAVPGTPDVIAWLWKDEAGNEHPDVHKKTEKLLEPGARFTEEPAPVFIMGCASDAWAAAEDEIKSINKCRVLIQR